MGRMGRIARKALSAAVPERFVLWRRSGANGTVYLTFDDGPDPECTPKILDVLDRLGAPATFFLIGEKAKAQPHLVHDILARGHTIGNHSYSHRVLPELSAADFPGEIDRTAELLSDMCGRAVTIFRPPKGLMTPGGMAYLLKRRLQVVFWTVDSMDYMRDSVERVVGSVAAARPSSGDIILLHDTNLYTVEALPRVVEGLRNSGLNPEAL